MLAGITGMVALMLGLMLTIQCTLSAVFVKLHNIERSLDDRGRADREAAAA